MARHILAASAAMFQVECALDDLDEPIFEASPGGWRLAEEVAGRRGRRGAMRIRRGAMRI
jgi:hypothetical protein